MPTVSQATSPYQIKSRRRRADECNMDILSGNTFSISCVASSTTQRISPPNSILERNPSVASIDSFAKRSSHPEGVEYDEVVELVPARVCSMLRPSIIIVLVCESPPARRHGICSKRPYLLGQFLLYISRSNLHSFKIDQEGKEARFVRR